MSMDLQSGVALKWALIASINTSSKDAEAKVSQELVDFTSWFMKELARIGTSTGIYFDYAAMPSCVQLLTPGDEIGCVQAYENVRKHFPSVLLVIHILPHANSEEYKWMKRCANRYGLIRQGLLYENALKRFEGCLEDVGRNISQWIARSVAEYRMAVTQNDKWKLCVGAGLRKLRIKYPLNQAELVDAVQSQNRRVQSDEPSAQCVRVFGLPMNFNEFSVAQAFTPLQVNAVKKVDSHFLVEFRTLIQALEAALYSGKVIDSRYEMSVLPCSTEVADQAKQFHELLAKHNDIPIPKEMPTENTATSPVTVE